MPDSKQKALSEVQRAQSRFEQAQSYDPWGAQLSGPTLEMGYLGAQQRRADPTTGLIQMGARPYAPALGVFMSEDFWNNPLTLYDLDGRFPSFGVPPL